MTNSSSSPQMDFCYGYGIRDWNQAKENPASSSLYKQRRLSGTGGMLLEWLEGGLLDRIRIESWVSWLGIAEWDGWDYGGPAKTPKPRYEIIVVAKSIRKEAKAKNN